MTGVHDEGSRRGFTAGFTTREERRFTEKTKVRDGRSLLAGDRKAGPTSMTREVVGFLGSGRIVDSARRTLGCVGWIHNVAIRTLIGGARQLRAGRVHRVTPDPLCPQHSYPARFAGHRADQRIVFHSHLPAITVHRPVSTRRNHPPAPVRSPSARSAASGRPSRICWQMSSWSARTLPSVCWVVCDH